MRKITILLIILLFLPISFAAITKIRDTTSIFNGLNNTGTLKTSSLIVDDLTAASCDVKSYTNGSIYCGTDDGADATGSGTYNPENASLINVGGVDRVNGSWLVTQVGNWSSVVGAGGWINSSTETNTTLNVNIQGNLTIGTGDVDLEMFSDSTNFYMNMTLSGDIIIYIDGEEVGRFEK